VVPEVGIAAAAGLVAIEVVKEGATVVTGDGPAAIAVWTALPRSIWTS
jgi:hypothetical protein